MAEAARGRGEQQRGSGGGAAAARKTEGASWEELGGGAVGWGGGRLLTRGCWVAFGLGALLVCNCIGLGWVDVWGGRDT